MEFYEEIQEATVFVPIKAHVSATTEILLRCVIPETTSNIPVHFRHISVNARSITCTIIASYIPDSISWSKFVLS